MTRTLLSLLLALGITIGTAWINPPTDERAMYGFEGSLEQNWRPRKLAGWPAPYMADNPSTSVIHKLGAEDDFRPGPFIATLSFWFVTVSAVGRFGRWIKRKMQR